MKLAMKQMYSFAKVGFVGLGNMGFPMACNLISKGHEVYGYDVDKSKNKMCQDEKIKFCNQIKDFGSQVDIFVTMLPNSKHSTQVCQGQGGIFQTAKKNTLIIDSSTISPLAAQQLNEKAKKHELVYLDAPVSGGVTGSKAGTLTFMVGAQTKSIFQKAQQILKCMGKNIFNCQKPGGGQIIKISNNMALAIQMIGICQSLAMAGRLGMDASEAAKILSVSTARSWSVDTYNPIPGYFPATPASRNYDNGFATDLMIKDLKLAAQAAQSCQTKTPLGKNSLQIYEELSRRGLGNKDFSIVYDLLKKNEF